MTTIAPSPTPCSGGGGSVNRTDVRLGGNCGTYSSTGKCIVPNSACTELSALNTWQCKCSQGYVRNNTNQCQKIPTGLVATNVFTTMMSTNDPVGSTVKSIPFSQVSGLISYTRSDTIIVPDSDEFLIENFTTNGLFLKTKSKLTKPKYDIVLIVSLTVGTSVLRDYVNIIVDVTGFDVIHQKIVIADGTPKGTIVGHLCKECLQGGTISASNGVLSVSNDGTIETTNRIDLDSMQSRDTIAYSTTVEIKTGSTLIANITLFIVRFNYFKELAEDSIAVTSVGKFNLLQSPIITNLRQMGFSISNDSKSLDLGTNSLDYESSKEIEKTLEMRIGDRITYISVKIKVTDVNDLKPTFGRDEYRFKMLHSVYPDIVVGVVFADDEDTNTILRYQINPDDKLKIDHNGVISIKSAIQNGTTYTAVVAVFDGTFKEEVDVTIDIIKVTEINLHGKYSGQILENAIIGTHVTTVYNSNYSRYDFTDQWNPNFKIDSTTGLITSARSFDREQKGRYNYTVVGHKKSAATCSLVVIGEVTIDITDVNDERPVFVHPTYNASVEEENNNQELTMNNPIFTTDKDLNSSVSYSIVSPSGMFSIDANTGIIKTQRTIDRETTRSLNVIVRAFDGINNASATVTVMIKDINDNSPIFTTINTKRINENIPLNSEVLTISASDRDEGRNAKITYAIERTEGYFRINQTSGVISTVRNLDRETNATHRVVVYARDNGDTIRSSSSTITFNIADVNDNAPTFNEDELNKDFLENKDCNSPILTASASDDDEPGSANSQVTYSILSGGDKFVIDINSGALKCKQPFDFEQQQAHTVVIQAQDHGNSSKSAKQTVIVSIKDINDNKPSFGNLPPTINIRYVSNNGTPEPQIVEIVNVTDLDSGDNGKVMFSLGGSAQSFLTIDERGVIRTKPYNISPTVYQLTITATDKGRPPLSQPATINVNVTIIKTQLVQFTKQAINMIIHESTPTGTIVQNVTTFVTNSNKFPLVYEIVDPDSVEAFSLDTSGIVAVKSVPDREIQTLHEFIIRVKNQNDHKDSDLSLVRVTILDVNDNKPTFERTKYYFRISENKNVNEVATPEPANLIASDKDDAENAIINFVINNNGDYCSSNFGLKINGTNTRSIILKQKVDFESLKSCQFTVTAFNPNNINMNSTIDATVHISDYNDNPPVFNKLVYNIEVPEDITVNSEMIYIGTVTDKDSRENGDVDVTVLNSNTCWFSVEKVGDKLGLKIKTNQALDYDSGSRDNICNIIATDKAKRPMPVLTASSSIVIKLTDVNDNDPVITNTDVHVNVSRDSDTGFKVVNSIPASDNDSGDNKELIYSIRASEYSQRFRIASNGQISINSPLTSIQKDKIALYILVSDKGNPPRFAEMKVTITLTDKNTRPYFIQSGYVEIPEEIMQPHGIIKQVQAYDRKNGDVIECDCDYFIDTKRDDIIINRTTGEIKFQYMNGTLDREKETNGEVVVAVYAKDKDVPPKRSATMQFVIKLTDINDHSPSFKTPTLTFVFNQKTPDGTVFGRLIAIDPDENPETTYTLNITNNVFIGDVVYINYITGDLIKSGNATLSSVDDAEITGYVRAEDAKDSTKSPGYARIIIKIEYDEKNNNTPTFERNLYEGTVSWDSKAPTSILQAIAVDDDEGMEGEIDYSIVSGNTRDFFSVDSKGIVSLAFLLDSSIGTGNRVTVELTIKAADKGIIPKYNHTSVRLLVTGSNPGYCVQGTEHSRQVNDAISEKDKWSYALFGLVAALCISILLCFFLLYKWRTSYPRDISEPDGRKKAFDSEEYAELNKRETVQYSHSNEAFEPPRRNIDFTNDSDPYQRLDDSNQASSFRQSAAEPMPDYPHEDGLRTRVLPKVSDPRVPSSYSPSS